MFYRAWLEKGAILGISAEDHSFYMWHVIELCLCQCLTFLWRFPHTSANTSWLRYICLSKCVNTFSMRMPEWISYLRYLENCPGARVHSLLYKDVYLQLLQESKLFWERRNTTGILTHSLMSSKRHKSRQIVQRENSPVISDLLKHPKTYSKVLKSLPHYA